MSQRAENGIVLIGFMGTGKTTVGRELADLTGLPFVDLDLEIGRQQGMTIPEIFATEGEKGFRRHESAALKRLADSPPCVLATGGGIVTCEENWPLLHRLGTVVYLRTRWATLQVRLADPAGRPLADGRDWSEITFPQNVKLCAICHTSGATSYRTNVYETPCLGCHGDNPGATDHMLQFGGKYTKPQ